MGIKTQQNAEKAISIHALREEGDTVCSHRRRSESDFYPRPPRGGRLLSSSKPA